MSAAAAAFCAIDDAFDVLWPWIVAIAVTISVGPPQYPTTLPTLDELIGIDGLGPDNVHRHVLALTEQAAEDQVYTLHAELEGMKLRPVFERLIDGWQAQGHQLVALGSLHEETGGAPLPLHRIGLGSVPGRSGRLAVQGEAWHA